MEKDSRHRPKSIDKRWSNHHNASYPKYGTDKRHVPIERQNAIRKGEVIGRLRAYNRGVLAKQGSADFGSDFLAKVMKTHKRWPASIYRP